jgi:hypothetical protein
MILWTNRLETRSMQILKGLTLHGESFAMDDKRFVDCTFVDCTIEYGGGPVILERTALRGCRYIFSGTAKMTLEFLECMG